MSVERDKPHVCEVHGVLIWSGECPDCVSEGVAVLSPAPARTAHERAADRALLLYRLALVRARTSRTASRIRRIGRGK